MNTLTTTTDNNTGARVFKQILDAPAQMLDTIEKASAANPTRANGFLSAKDFHGQPEISTFADLRAATLGGIETETREFKTALDAMAINGEKTQIKRTDEPAKIVDIASYLQGVPECYYKTAPKPQIKLNIVVFGFAPWFIPAECIKNRAAAIVALVKKLKAARASVRLEIAFEDSPRTRFPYRANVRLPINFDALNIGQFAFITSPAFMRTYIFMLHETILNNWTRALPYDEISFGLTTHSDDENINFLDFYQTIIQANTKARKRKLNIEQAKTLYGTPERAFATIEKQFEAEISRLKKA